MEKNYIIERSMSSFNAPPLVMKKADASGRKFTILKDHRPLSWLFNLKNSLSKLARWRIELEQYTYEIIYKPGKLNGNEDALSRMYNIKKIKKIKKIGNNGNTNNKSKREGSVRWTIWGHRMNFI